MQSTRYGLDILRARPEFLKIPVVEEKLLNGKVVNLMRAFEMTGLFVNQTIMYYSLEDVGVDKIKEWVNKISLIKKAALKKGDNKLAEFCDQQLIVSKQKWSEIF